MLPEYLKHSPLPEYLKHSPKIFYMLCFLFTLYYHIVNVTSTVHPIFSWNILVIIRWYVALAFFNPNGITL